MTTIHSNGSKWGGEEPDTIEKLVEVLKKNTLEKRFFFKLKYLDGNDKVKFCTNTPICIEEGAYMFFGNFEEVSHVFRIETKDRSIINTLRSAIMNNRGYKEYVKTLREKAQFKRR